MSISNIEREKMKKKYVIGCFITTILLLSISSLSSGASLNPSQKIHGLEDRWYSGIILVNGRYTTMKREFGPIPFCVLLTCKENNIRVIGMNIEYNGWLDRFYFSPISESYFSKITLAGFYVGICRLGQVHAIAFSVLIWG
jgi:hypothetical protein